MSKSVGDRFFPSGTQAPTNARWIINQIDDNKSQIFFRLPAHLPPKLELCILDELPVSFHNYLPKTVKQLVFWFDDDSAYDEICEIPEGVEELEITNSLKHLRPGLLPQSLQSLIVYELQSPLDSSLPSSLTSFEISSFTFELTQDMFPISLQHLSLGRTLPGFVPNFLPPSLTSLFMHCSGQLVVGCLPPTLIILEIERYNQPLDVGVLPDGLEELILPSFRLPFTQEALPPRLFKLILFDFTWEWREGSNFPYYERYTLMKQLEEAKLHFFSMIDRERNTYVRVQELTVACGLAKNSRKKKEQEKLLIDEKERLKYARNLLSQSDIVVNEIKIKLNALK